MPGIKLGTEKVISKYRTEWVNRWIKGEEGRWEIFERLNQDKLSKYWAGLVVRVGSGRVASKMMPGSPVWELGMPELFWLTILWHPMYGCFPHNNQFSNSPDTIWVSNNSIQFWHYWPGVSFRAHRLRAQSHKHASTSDANSKAQVPTCTPDIGGFYNPLFRFSNLLEWLIELRETLYLYSPVSYKGYDSATAK